MSLNQNCKHQFLYDILVYSKKEKVSNEQELTQSEPNSRPRLGLQIDIITSSPKGNDAHLRATIQSEIKWKDQFSDA